MIRPNDAHVLMVTKYFLLFTAFGDHLHAKSLSSEMCQDFNYTYKNDVELHSQPGCQLELLSTSLNYKVGGGQKVKGQGPSFVQMSNTKCSLKAQILVVC